MLAVFDEDCEEVEDVDVDDSVLLDSVEGVEDLVNDGEIVLGEPVNPNIGDKSDSPPRLNDAIGSMEDITHLAADGCGPTVGSAEFEFIVKVSATGSLLRLLLVDVPPSYDVGAALTNMVSKSLRTSERIVTVLMLATKLDISSVGSGPGKKQSGCSVVSIVNTGKQADHAYFTRCLRFWMSWWELASNKHSVGGQNYVENDDQ